MDLQNVLSGSSWIAQNNCYILLKYNPCNKRKLQQSYQARLRNNTIILTLCGFLSSLH